MTNREVLTEDQLIAGLLEYIKLNKCIPEAFAAFESDAQYRPDLDALQLAIQQGNTDAPIFNHPSCTLYVLYLIQKRHLPFWYGMTVYTYLIALAQYTDRQPLKPEDMKYKDLRPVNVMSIFKEGELTAVGDEYLKLVCTNFKNNLNVDIDEQALAGYIATLPPSEQWVLSISMEGMPKAIRPFLLAVQLNLPFCKGYDSERMSDPKLMREKRDKDIIIPSASVINYLTMLASPTQEPYSAKPIFGAIKETTLASLHQKFQHPVSLYSVAVKFNLTEAHGYDAGPFPLWLHDIGHTFWGSLLLVEDVQFVFDRYIPLLQTLLTENIMDTAKDRILQIIKQSNDLDLTPIRQLGAPADRLERYLRKSFGSDAGLYSSQSSYDDKIGSIPEDQLFYLFMNKINQLRVTESPDYPKFAKVKSSLYPSHAGYRQQSIRDALFGLIDISTIRSTQTLHDQLLGSNINAPLWKKLLDSTSDSATIWQEVVNNNEYHLLTLIERGLKFFHPVLPLSSLEYQRLKNYIDERCRLMSRSTTPYTPRMTYGDTRSIATKKMDNEAYMLWIRSPSKRPISPTVVSHTSAPAVYTHAPVVTDSDAGVVVNTRAASQL